MKSVTLSLIILLSYVLSTTKLIAMKELDLDNEKKPSWIDTLELIEKYKKEHRKEFDPEKYAHQEESFDELLLESAINRDALSQLIGQCRQQGDLETAGKLEEHIAYFAQLYTHERERLERDRSEEDKYERFRAMYEELQ